MSPSQGEGRRFESGPLLNSPSSANSFAIRRTRLNVKQSVLLSGKVEKAVPRLQRMMCSIFGQGFRSPAQRHHNFLRDYRTKQNPSSDWHCQRNCDSTSGHHSSRSGSARCQTQRSCVCLRTDNPHCSAITLATALYVLKLLLE